MSVQKISTYLRFLFLFSTIIVIATRILGMELFALFFTPFLTLSLIYDYHISVGKDQTLYFIFIFCLIGDLTVIIDDFYFFISALMAYWGAAILFCFVLNKELEKALVPLLYKWKYCLPFIFYGSYFILLMYLIKPYLKELFIPIIIYAATLSFAAALRIIVYIERRTKSIAYLSSGLVLLSITASLIGINRFYYKSDFLHGIETLLYAPTLFLIFLYFKTKTIDEF